METKLNPYYKPWLQLKKSLISLFHTWSKTTNNNMDPSLHTRKANNACSSKNKPPFIRQNAILSIHLVSPRKHFYLRVTKPKKKKHVPDVGNRRGGVENGMGETVGLSGMVN
jgi:hypothetical protein